MLGLYISLPLSPRPATALLLPSPLRKPCDAPPTVTAALPATFDALYSHGKPIQLSLHVPLRPQAALRLLRRDHLSKGGCDAEDNREGPSIGVCAASHPVALPALPARLVAEQARLPWVRGGLAVANAAELAVTYRQRIAYSGTFRRSTWSSTTGEQPPHFPFRNAQWTPNAPPAPPLRKLLRTLDGGTM